MRLCLLMLALTLACPAHARLYQWIDPYSGTTQLSGNAPAWYRGPKPGPRVLVFERGELIDDTAIEVVDGERQRLHEAARAGAAMALPEPSGAPVVPDIPVTAPTSPASAPAPAAATTAPPATAAAAQAAALKQLIDAWDQQQLEHARSLLDLVPESAPAATPP